MAGIGSGYRVPRFGFVRLLNELARSRGCDFGNWEEVFLHTRNGELSAKLLRAASSLPTKVTLS